jgi:hypothetical protein
MNLLLLASSPMRGYRAEDFMDLIVSRWLLQRA